MPTLACCRWRASPFLGFLGVLNPKKTPRNPVQVESINLAGVDRVVACTALTDGLLLLRQYVVKLKKSGTKLPRVELQVGLA